MKPKQLFPILLSLVLLCGCGKKNAPVQPAEETIAPVAPQTSAPTEQATPSPISERERSQCVFVRYAEEEKEYRAEGSNDLLLTYRCRTPMVDLPDLQKQAGKINAALASLSESFRKGAADGEDSGLENMLSTAAYHYAQWSVDDPSAEFPPYVYERDGSVVRGDGTVISLLFSDYFFSGGVHGSTAWSGVSFDPETGEQLTLEQLTDDIQALRQICMAEIQSQCEEMKDSLFDDYASYVEELFTDGLWYLNDSGLVFIANEYHLAPYATGTLSFTVRYRDLKGVLSARYMLPDRSDVQGGVEAFRESDVHLGSTVPKLETVLDDFGERIVFAASNTVYNVRLFSVEYEESSGKFRQTRELAYLSALHDGEYFILQSTIPDVVPNVQLSWRLPDGSSQRYLLSQSGEDGSILLIEPNTLSRIQPGQITAFPFVWDLEGDGFGESLQLTMDDVWKLRVNEYEAATAYGAEPPRLFVADVDENECCELFLEAGSTVCCFRFNGEIQAVNFILKGEAVSWLNATVLDASADGLHVSCNIPLLGTKQPAQAVYRDGKDGTLALAYGTFWDFFTRGTLTLSKEISYTASDGSRRILPAGAAITPTVMDDETLFFTVQNGESGNIGIEELEA